VASGNTLHQMIYLFNWTGAYLIKADAGGVRTCEGSVLPGVFKCWRDIKLHKTT